MSKVEPLCSVSVAPPGMAAARVVVLIVPLPGCGAKVAPPATVIAVSSTDEPAAKIELAGVDLVGPE